MIQKATNLLLEANVVHQSEVVNVLLVPLRHLVAVPNAYLRKLMELVLVQTAGTVRA
jgi:hypothetical protein